MVRCIFLLKVMTVIRPVVLAFLLSALGCQAIAQSGVTPDQWLKSLPKPVFKTNHNLLHLARWGWTISSNCNVELAKNWGYALDLGEVSYGITNDLATPTSTIYGLVHLAATNSNFKLACTVPRDWQGAQVQTSTNLPKDLFVTNSSGLFVDRNNQHQWADGTNAPYLKVLSAEASDANWTNLVQYWTAGIKAVQAVAPLSIIMHGWESIQMEVPINFGGAEQNDPRFWAVTNQPIFLWPTNDIRYVPGLNYPAYVSQRQAHYWNIIQAELKRICPNREAVVAYNSNGEAGRTSRYGWVNTGWYVFDSFPDLTPNLDYPNLESYYGDGRQNWTPDARYYFGIYHFYDDLLSRYLNAVGFNSARGYKTNYSWVSGGWGADLSDLRYTGLLKCLYLGGMNGGIAGQFSYPPEGMNPTFNPTNPPYWLPQMIALSHVHAFFSHWDDFLANSDLISGPQNHLMSVEQPAYEFTNTVGAVWTRVLARKHRTQNQWLICAWAQDGINRNVTVNIPVLGSVTLLAREAGTIYQATTTNLTLLDLNGPFPTLPATLNPPTRMR